MTDVSVDQQELLKPTKKLLVESRGMGMSAEERAAMTLACRDSDYIPRVSNAGKTVEVNGVTAQVMHNGIYVKKGAYQGDWQAKVIEGLKGNHEPQEEKVFYEVLKKVRPGGTMLELGSWWSYYSMWFLKSVKGGKTICTEPDPENLALGRLNMKLNSFSSPKDVVFYEAAAGLDNGKIISFVTEKATNVRVPIRTVDSILSEQKLDKLDILHMDIQGAELEALKGAQKSIKQGKVRFLFVSTHHYVISDDPLMHQKCLGFIVENGGHVISEHTVAQSCSGDGLIVVSFDPKDKGFSVEVSLQPTDKSSFRQPERDVALLWDAREKLLEHEASLNKQLEKEKQGKFEQTRQLQWIYTHSLRFALVNLYHVYIKRDRKHGESS